MSHIIYYISQVSWGLWCFSQSISTSDVNWLAGEFKKKTWSKGMNFSDPKFVEWPNKTFNAYYQGFLVTDLSCNHLQRPPKRSC